MVNKVIAFIPVRGGSKSIPLKNIKDFCGKPLVYWNISALQDVAGVDQIVIATDSEEIENVIRSFGFDKVVIFKRSKQNATDTASTESVMLEYISQAELSPTDIFILVQATSPLTQQHHFKDAISMFLEGNFDSILSCVESYRFFWNEDGSPKNYNINSRPRRQDFKGSLMENGAFYINTISNILLYQNRLGGKIGIYIMPEYTSFEIDEPDDWSIMEELMRRHVLIEKQPLNKQIKLFLTDVDGVLTDGGMYYSETGDELKKFNTRDGMAFDLLRKAGIKTGIITSENTKIVESRAKKIKADFLFQGKKEGGKLAAAVEICEQLNISLEEVAYIGDDINCFELLNSVGIKACPADASNKIKSIEGINILERMGGFGCVREFIDTLILPHSV